MLGSRNAKRKRFACGSRKTRATKRVKRSKTCDIVRLNIFDLENQLKERRVEWQGRYYYPVCLGYRLAQERGIQATRNVKLQAMMTEASRYFCVSKDARVISTKTHKIKRANMLKQGNSGKEEYRRGTLRLQSPVQNSTFWHVSLHRLVMYTFDPVFDPEDFVVHHIVRKDTNEYFRERDFDAVNGSATVRSNRFEHLRWTTVKENNQTKNKIRVGKRPKWIYPILATNLATNEKTRFGSVEEAIVSLNKAHLDKKFHRRRITAVASNRRKAYHGYRFEKLIPTLPGEVWVNVPQTKTKVSNFGRIFNRKGLSKGTTEHQNNGLQYVATQLSYTKTHPNEPAKSKRKYVHRLVYEALNGPISPGMLIDHIDGYGHHNCIKNLHMVTHSENRRNCGQRNIFRGKCEFCGFHKKKMKTAQIDSLARSGR